MFHFEHFRDTGEAGISSIRTIAKVTAYGRSVCALLIAPALTTLVFGFYSTAAQAGETCSEGWGPGQYFDDLSVCVSSALAAQGRSDYRPANLLDGPKNAWCEGVAGDGLGQTITFRIPNAVFPDSFHIRAGYTKSLSAFLNNASPSRLLIRNDAGDSQLVTLADTRDTQIIPIPWSGGPVNWISFEILSVRAGRKYHDTCITSLSPDFEGS